MKTKNSYPIDSLSTSSSIFIFFPEGAVGYLCLALSASHYFLDFGQAVGFHPFLQAILFYIITILGFQLPIDTRALGDALRGILWCSFFFKKLDWVHVSFVFGILICVPWNKKNIFPNSFFRDVFGQCQSDYETVSAVHFILPQFGTSQGQALQSLCWRFL